MTWAWTAPLERHDEVWVEYDGTTNKDEAKDDDFHEYYRVHCNSVYFRLREREDSLAQTLYEKR